VASQFQDMHVFVLAVLMVSVSAKSSLIWLCLERCSGFDFALDVSMLQQHKLQFQIVSYENWQVSPEGKLQFATHNGIPVSDVGFRLLQLGFKLFPMLTSADIKAMRALFSSPTSLIQDSIQKAKENSYIGYHIDFEPEFGVVKSDASLYATFVDLFAKELQKEGLILSIDVATWSILWDYDLLGKTSVNKIYTMQTYTNNITRFTNEVQHIVQAIGKEKAAVGFDSDITGTSNLPQMLSVLEEWNIGDIGLWRDNSVVPSQWFDFIANFLNNKV